MNEIRAFLMIVFDGCQLLDISGPASVISAANTFSKEEVYSLEFASFSGGRIKTETGMQIETAALDTLNQKSWDTILVVGGGKKAIGQATQDQALLDWITENEKNTQRLASVCSGSFILAAAGLLTGRKATTHWSACDRLCKLNPDIEVSEEALFVVDGKIWTSAGVTTGIDMALAMVEQDFGAEMANWIARQLVLYARRPGYQTQFSSVLEAQTRADNEFGLLINWIGDHLKEDLTVETLADQAGMSLRNFHRRFTGSTGVTPAHFVANLRLDTVKTLITRGVSFKETARVSGFSSAVQMSIAFQRRFGVKASFYKNLHRSK